MDGGPENQQKHEMYKCTPDSTTHIYKNNLYNVSTDIYNHFIRNKITENHKKLVDFFKIT